MYSNMYATSNRKKLISFDELPEMLTTRQIAEWLQIDINTVSVWIRKGVLKAVSIPESRIYRINKKDLAELIKASTTM